MRIIFLLFISVISSIDSAYAQDSENSETYGVMRQCQTAKTAADAKACFAAATKLLDLKGGPAGSILRVQQLTGHAMDQVADPNASDDLMNEDTHTAPDPSSNEQQDTDASSAPQQDPLVEGN